MAKKTFESALKRLEQIAEELEKGDQNLEKSLKKFDEGVGLVKFLNDQLETAKNRVNMLIKKNNSLISEDFDEDDRGD